MRINPLFSLKTAATGLALAATVITGLYCGDDKPTGNSSSTSPAGQWRVDNWTPPDTSGYITFNDGGVKMEMVYVEGGTFTMGCTMPKEDYCYFDNGGYVTKERCDGGIIQNLCEADEYPAHQVTVDGFYIGKFEITVKQYKDILEKEYFIHMESDYYPACFNSTDLSNFLNKLNTKTNKNYRLPTEAEWEFAARGGRHSKNRAFAGSDNVYQIGWLDNHTGNIGTKLPNELGIYDMSGNEDEIVSDWYAPYTSEPQINPQGPTSGQSRITRGGRDSDYESDLRVSSRKPISSSKQAGLRLVLDAN